MEEANEFITKFDQKTIKKSFITLTLLNRQMTQNS